MWTKPRTIGVSSASETRQSASRIGCFVKQVVHCSRGRPLVSGKYSGRVVYALDSLERAARLRAPRLNIRHRRERGDSSEDTSRSTSFSFAEKESREIRLAPWVSRFAGFFYFFLWTNPMKKVARKKDLVRMRGLEPPRVSPLPPQSSVSTSSTTSAPKTVAIAMAIDSTCCRRPARRRRSPSYGAGVSF